MSDDSDIQLWLSLSGSCPWALLRLWGCQTSGSALCAAELLPVPPSCRTAAASSSPREQTGGLSLKVFSLFHLGPFRGEDALPGAAGSGFSQCHGGGAAV